MTFQNIIVAVTLLFFSSLASAGECYTSSIVSPAPFMGNNGEIFRLNDGSIWEVKHEYEYLYEYYPEVIICPSKGKLIINTNQLNVKLIQTVVVEKKGDTKKDTLPEVIESQVDGQFNGWEGETVIKLMNGQIWQQTQHYYHYHYAYMPNVLIYRSEGIYKMKVDGVEKAVGVSKLK